MKKLKLAPAVSNVRQLPELIMSRAATLVVGVLANNKRLARKCLTLNCGIGSSQRSGKNKKPALHCAWRVILNTALCMLKLIMLVKKQGVRIYRKKILQILSILSAITCGRFSVCPIWPPGSCQPWGQQWLSRS